MALDEELINDVRKIRKILESSSIMAGFPRGCCGDSSDVLGLFILKKYGKQCQYHLAKGLGDNPSATHAWIVCEGYIIDITADQFNDRGYALESVIIAKDNGFYTKFHKCNCSNGYPYNIKPGLNRLQGMERLLFKVEKSLSCPCCKKGISINRPRLCPLCLHEFKGNGWDGVDAHWRSKHENVMTYEEFWESLCDEHKK